MKLTCAICGTMITAPWQTEKKRQFHLKGGLTVIIKNVEICQCDNCQSTNFWLGKDGKKNLFIAIAKQFKQWPVNLTGQQFQWLINFLVNFCALDEIFAGIVGFDKQFSLMKDQHWSFTEANIFQDEDNQLEPKFKQEILLIEKARQLVARKLGFDDFQKIKYFFDNDYLPEDIDNRIRELLEWVNGSSVFPADIKYDKKSGAHYILVDASSAKLEALKKEEERRHFLKEINRLLRQIQRNPLGWQLYNTMLTELNLAVIGSFINYKDDNRKENLSIAFCFFNQADQSLYVNRVVVDNRVPHRETVIIRLFEDIFRHAETFSDIRKIFLEKPRQVDVLQAARDIGFIDSKNKKYLYVDFSQHRIS